MDIHHLESFVEVIRQGSFTRAAEHLYLSQPTISAHIRALEEELECLLLYRTTKTVDLTPIGREIFDYAVSILQLRDKMLRLCQPEERVVIQLGASTIPSAYILPDILSHYGKLHPEVFFVIHQSDSQKVIDGLAEGVFDIGFTGMPAESPELTCIPFCQDRMILIAPVDERYLKLQDDPEHVLETLLREPLILRESGSGSRKAAERFLEKMGFEEENLNVIARVNDQEAIKNMVASGIGVSVISEKAAKNFLEEKRLLSFELPEEASIREFYVIFRKNFLLKEYAARFVDFVQGRKTDMQTAAGRTVQTPDL